MVGVTFVIALLELALHLRPLLVAAPGRAIAPPSEDALGARFSGSASRSSTPPTR
jgi:hypothetical protein